MVEHFICDLLEMADNTCHAYREDKSDPKFEMKVKNPAIPMEYDVIAVAASMKLDFFDHKTPTNLLISILIQLVRLLSSLFQL